MEMTLAERIMHSTLRIEMLDTNCRLVGTATGFVFSFCKDEQRGIHTPVLITNRHVLGGCQKIRVTFTLKKEDLSPDIGRSESVVIDTSLSIFHPNPQIDLAVIIIAPALRELKDKQVVPFYAILEPSIIPGPEIWAELDAIENVTMIGYPHGLIDNVNNLPIFRRGITATPPAYDFRGEPKFLADMACYPGSSGSPVFLFDEGGFSNPRKHSFQLGTRLFLLGVQYAAPTAKTIGELSVVPNAQPSVKPVFDSFYNLGLIIKSTELLAFEPILKAMYK